MAAPPLILRWPAVVGSPRLVLGQPEVEPGVVTAYGDLLLPAPELLGAAAHTRPPGATAGGDLEIGDAAMEITGTAVYAVDVSRPLVARARGRWQAALPLQRSQRIRWQDAAAQPSSLRSRWQRATPLHASLRSRWQDTVPLPRSLGGRFQDALRVSGQTLSGFQDAVPVYVGRAARFQDALPEHRRVASRFQEQIRVYSGHSSRFQDALPLAAGWVARGRGAAPVYARWGVRYQDAIPLGPGRRIPPKPPEPDPCYIPNARLVLREPWTGSARLILICERHDGPGPEPGATVVVPIRTVYMTTNSLTLVRADTGQPIPAESFALSIDADSWTWSWSASVQQAGLALLLGAAGDDPREVIATINGVPYWLCAESVSRERTFGNARVRVQGRGRAAVLDAPYAPVLNHAAATAQTAQQLMALALQINGVGIGWSVDWGVTDWLVPANTWTHQGTHIGAVLDIASAAGAIVQPHRTAKTLRVLPRYPAMPRDWATLTPDFELPADVAQVEGLNWVTKPGYNRAHVAGTTAAGVLGEYTLTGSAGDLPAPMVTHPLITHADAARQRALPILADAGAQVPMSLSLPVLSETGLILPGSLVRYRDTTVAGHPSRLGLVRGMSLQQNWPTLRQTLELETHGV